MIQVTDDERRVLRTAFLLAMGIALGLSVLFAGLWWYAGRSDVPIDLEDTINPNTATEASLLRLPGLGPQRAQAMVAYREEVQRNLGRPAFRDLNDVDAVPGLGPATVRVMAPYLRFEGK
jgi:competence ComEA-like helix-hairpin-helix protein